MRLANANAALWAVGNGLVSSLLVIYLAAELGAAGLAISFILAAPRFAGVLRLGVPALMAGRVSRKHLCIGAYLISAMLLCMVPVAATFAHQMATRGTAMGVLVGAWCLYHLTEYVGTIALWSWLGDLTPRRVRGRLLGQRERWLIAGRLVGLSASASLALVWPQLLPEGLRWQPLALSAAVGAVMMMAAVVPLIQMTAARQAPSAVPHAPWRTVIQAIVDPVYRRLVLYSCWMSLVNGISGAAQEIYPIRVLGIAYPVRLLLQGMMRGGQLTIAPWAGRLVDRWGNRPVLVATQLIVATGPLFYLMATPQRPWIVAGAFVVWIAYAGLNVGLDNIKLKLAPETNNAPYIAAYYALSDLAYGVSIIVGGILLDRLYADGESALRLFAQLFLWGWVGRSLAAGLAARIREPVVGR